MRTLRPFLIGTVILTLLAGLGGTVAVQAAEAPTDGSAVVEFTVPYGSHGGIPKPSVEEGRNAYRDFIRRIDLYDTGDARLNGRLRLLQNSDTLHDGRGSVAVGTAVMDLDDAGWRGTFRGYGKPGTSHSLILVELRGEDAYEGLSAMLFLDRDETTITQGNNGTYDVEGLVFSGDLPPMPDTPE